MKLPYDAAPPAVAHDMALMKHRFPGLGLVLDLQNQQGVYDTRDTGVAHRRVTFESKKIPTHEDVRAFCNAANAWWAEPGHGRY